MDPVIVSATGTLFSGVGLVVLLSMASKWGATRQEITHTVGEVKAIKVEQDCIKREQVEHGVRLAKNDVEHDGFREALHKHDTRQ